MPEEGIQKLNHDDILTFEQLYPIVEVAVELGISKIRITGGEPLVRKGIVNFIEKISKLSGLKDIAMTTNGILLERYAQELKEAGLHRLNISLDTLKEDRYKMITRWGELNQVLRGIEATEKAGLSPIKINVVAMRGINDDEIEDFARLTKEKPYHVRFIELMPMGEAEEIEGERFITNEEILNRLPDLIPLINEDGSGPAKYYKLPNSKGSIGFISPMSNHFCKSCNRIRLTADGKIKPCLHSNFEIDLKLAKTKEEIRNILQKGILLKPERHYLKEGSESSIRGMNQIGG